MKIAAYNLNNLFERPKVFELDGFAPEAKAILNDYNKLLEFLAKQDYTNFSSEITAIIKRRVEVPAAKKYFEINQVKNKLYSVSKGKINLKAQGKDDWLGWVDLVKEGVNEIATQNTAKVMDSLNVDILCTIEVENRIALENFNNGLLASKFKYSMLIDGNDLRGIDVGIYSNHLITNIESHIFDTYAGTNGRLYKIFSRDCPIYTIDYNGAKVYVLCNHLKSQGYGGVASNNQKRKLQAQRVKEILSEKFDLKKDYVVVAGDLNDVPDSDPLSPLLGMPNLENIIERKGKQGTYLRSKKQFDYLLVSKSLADKYVDAGVERRGIFKAPNSFVTKEVEQASDHGAVWAEFNL